MKFFHRLRKLKSFQSFAKQQTRAGTKRLDGSETNSVRQTGKSMMVSSHFYFTVMTVYNRRVPVKQIMSGAPFKTKLIP